MPPKRGRAGRAGRVIPDRKAAVGRRRAQQSTPKPKDEASSAYQDMLAEAASRSPSRDEEGRPLKRRKTGPSDRRARIQEESPVNEALVQTIMEDTAPSEGSDMDWEQVDFDEEEDSNHLRSAADDAAAKDISIDLSQNKKPARQPMPSRRLPGSTAEKQKRLLIHKIHLCCLLAHVYICNSRCNDEKTQAILSPLLSSKTVSYLNPDPSLSQFQKSRSFVDGLEKACEAFRSAYQICTRGLRRSRWDLLATGSEKVIPASEFKDSVDREDFFQLAQDLEGSRDDGAQLFCALLRSVGVDARLVCSLQVLPFTAPAPISTQTNAESKPTIDLRGGESYRTTDDNSGSESGRLLPVQQTSLPINGLQRIKRLGAGSSSAMSLGVPPPSAVKHNKILESPFPVFWVEAFNVALQKWLPVDPLVTKTIAKPTKIEPPAVDSLNGMSYVVAFEDDGTAKDVTRRYAKAYNAKTRRSRIESIKGGEAWWKKLMKAFDSGYEADRDQVEDAELAQKEASEPMPRNVQDFKDHPYYALERHLRRNEVMHPKKEIGKLSGSKASDATQPIYRRRDVHVVKSADKWYRSGRDIKPDEQPLKYSTSSRRQRARSASPSSDHEDDSSDFVGLYARFQTTLYHPPPVVGGRIPKNVYRNLDVHVPSMIPPGGVHVRASEAGKAAKILGVDYADAVTGFKFKGWRGSAVMDGVVVAKEFAEAIKETVLGLRWVDELAERNKKGKLAVGLWKRFLVGLRIRQRVMRYADEDEDEEGGDEDGRTLVEQVDEAIVKEEESQGQGGFLPDTTLKGAMLDSEGEGTVDVSLDDGFMDERSRPSNDRILCIPSPWDRPPRQTAPRHPQRLDESSSPTKLDVDVDDIFEESGGVEQSRGGFLIPTSEENSLPIPHAVPETHNGEEKPPQQMPMVQDVLPPGTQFSAPDDAAAVEVDVEINVEAADEIEIEADAEADFEAAVEVDVEAAVEADVEAEAEPKPETEAESVRKDSPLDDASSMISHDPDDEDAEPEWLT